MIIDLEAGPSKANNKDAVNKKKVCTSNREPVKRNPTSPKKTSTYHVLHTRSSPKALYNTISTLKPTQKACLEQLGFGNLVEFKVDGIPSKLGCYVVDMFDADKKELKLVEGSIEITKDLISDMLGIRNEGIDIMDEKVNRNEEMVSSWMEQYDNPKNIKPSDLPSEYLLLLSFGTFLQSIYFFCPSWFTSPIALNIPMCDLAVFTFEP